MSVAADTPSRRRRVRRPGSLRVDRLVPGKHRHALGDLPGARLGPLDGNDPADEGEAVGLGEHVEHRLRRRVGGDRGLQVGRHLRFRRRRIGGRPLGATYTPRGLRLDRLTNTQRAILNHLNIALPWPEQGQD